MNVRIISNDAVRNRWLSAFRHRCPGVDTEIFQDITDAVISPAGLRHGTNPFAAVVVCPFGPGTFALDSNSLQGCHKDEFLWICGPCLNSPPEAARRLFDFPGSNVRALMPVLFSKGFAVFKRMVAGSIGPVGSFVIEVERTSPDTAPDRLSDPGSAPHRLISLLTGIAGAPVAWNPMRHREGVPLSITGNIEGPGIPVEIRFDGAGPSILTVNGKQGSAEALIDENRLVLNGGDAYQIADIFDAAAAMCAEVASGGLSRLPPGRLAAAAGISISGLRSSFSADINSQAERGAFVENSFVATDTKGLKAFSEIKVFVADRCNLKCPFCFSPSPELPVSTPDRWFDLFAGYIREGYDAVLLSGGEPTLNSDLELVVRAAAESGMKRISLETNAIMFGRGDLAGRLASAGLSSAMVSLHSLKPETSLLMSGVPGIVPQVRRGIAALQAAGIGVAFNVVTTARNYSELPDLADYAVRCKPRPTQVILSFMAGTGGGAQHPELFARMEHAAPYMDRALNVLKSSGIDCVVPGQCGVPQCVLPGHLDVFCNEMVASNIEDWSACGLLEKTFGPDCIRCSRKSRCYGIWRSYSERYGFDEFRPLA